jgi:putative transposase
MNCPYCDCVNTTEQKQRTALGYLCYRCTACRRKFNERTGTAYNYLEYPTDIVMLVVIYRLRYKLSLRDLAEMFLLRGFQFTHEAVREWESRFAPLITEHIRDKRKGTSGRAWYVDETYLKINGQWHYLYRCIDRDGNLVDVMLSKHRDMNAAQNFFKQALEIAGKSPLKVTTDGHDSYPRAVKEVLGERVEHRNNQYLNNRIEQDHRSIKQRYYPMRGFGNFDSAARFCSAFEEIRQYFRYRSKTSEMVSLHTQRQLLLEQWTNLQSWLNAA